MSAFTDLLSRADPAVRGVVLTGSYARGLAAAHSDHDVIIVVDDGAGWETSRSAALDEIDCTSHRPPAAGSTWSSAGSAN